jgi:hypothetical protein
MSHHSAIVCQGSVWAVKCGVSEGCGKGLQGPRPSGDDRNSAFRIGNTRFGTLVNVAIDLDWLDLLCCHNDEAQPPHSLGARLLKLC